MRRAPKIDDRILLPGRYLIGGNGCRMRALLDTGVAITLWHRELRIGAMAHFLPAAGNAGISLELDGDDGAIGLQRVLQAMRWSQIDPADCVARICGSGMVIARADNVPSLNSGQRGGECARRLLRDCALPIVAESFYARGRHQIIFDVGTGRIQARRVKPVVVAIAAQPQPATPQPMRRGGSRVGAMGR